jgi:hypothetical protein
MGEGFELLFDVGEEGGVLYVAADDVEFGLLEQTAEYLERVAAIVDVFQVAAVHLDLVAHFAFGQHELLLRVGCAVLLCATVGVEL